MAKYVVLLVAAAALAGCQTTTYDGSAAGGTAPAATDVRVRLDSGVIQDFGTDYTLREGDRVVVLANGKIAPL